MKFKEKEENGMFVVVKKLGSKKTQRRAGARLEMSLYSKLRNLDFYHWQWETTEDAIRSWAQKEGLL